MLTLFSIALSLLTAIPASAQKGEDVLAKAAETYENANGISASFALHVRNDKQQVAESFEGVIQMKKR